MLRKPNSMVVVKDIELYSLCEHHMLPFYGRCQIGFIRRGRVFGISKLARLVDLFAQRLQIQEWLMEQIAYAIKDSNNADGVGVMIETRHFCMMMRDVQKQNSMFVTSSVLGVFCSNPATREEFFRLSTGKTPSEGTAHSETLRLIIHLKPQTQSLIRFNKMRHVH